MSDERFRVTYTLTCDTGEDPAVRAHEIALEQTVELPESCVSEAILERVVGHVEAVDHLDGRRWRAVISYSSQTVGPELPQLLNLLFGNISLKRGSVVRDVKWPARWLERFTGPRHGIDGVRRICGSSRRRPLLCAALKPMGLSSGDLAGLCGQFARGGVDLVKDDHGLADQADAPFDERVARCQATVEQVNRETGGSTLYVPNLTGPADVLEPRVRRVHELGCRAILLSPLIVGLDTVRRISADSGLAIFAHPALCGAFFHEDHGISPGLLLGQIFRIAGSDGVIYPNVGGRFPFTESTCKEINAGLRDDLGALRPAFPMPGGGLDAGRVTHWTERYGVDIIFLIGGGLYAQTDLAPATRKMMEAIQAAGG